MVAYADVDLMSAEIIGHDGEKAVSSRLDVNDVLYATVFATADEKTLSSVDRYIEPVIIGQTFTAWINYNGDTNANVGDTNAYAGMKATYVYVTVKYVAGVDYYMNGMLYDVYDIPSEVPFGSYFSAKISDTSKYQGNPLINGQKTIVVDEDMVLQATGVTPIPEPAPEPTTDSGLTLTDILLIVLVVLIAIMVVILVLRLNRS
jgi:hypothetical protein